MNDDYLLLINTCPNLDTARKLALLLVEQRLAACVNILPGVQSVYEWEGKIVEDTELILLIKTRRGLYPQVEALMIQEHPYEVPEVISLSIDSGLPAYLDWIGEVTAGG